MNLTKKDMEIYWIFSVFRALDTHWQNTHLIARPASEAVRVELVDMENVDRTLDAEVMELAGHF